MSWIQRRVEERRPWGGSLCSEIRRRKDSSRLEGKEDSGSSKEEAGYDKLYAYSLKDEGMLF